MHMKSDLPWWPLDPSYRLASTQNSDLICLSYNQVSVYLTGPNACLCPQYHQTQNSVAKTWANSNENKQYQCLWKMFCEPGPRFNIKTSSYQYRKSHCGDKTILRPSYLHNGVSYNGNTTSLYWIRAMALTMHQWVHCMLVDSWLAQRASGHTPFSLWA